MTELGWTEIFPLRIIKSGLVFIV